MKFMKKKIAVVLLVLFACTGMAMAQSYNQQRAYNEGYQNGTNGAANTCTSDYNRVREQKSCNDGYTAGYQATH